MTDASCNGSFDVMLPVAPSAQATTLPLTSPVNWRAGQTRSNNAIVPLPPSGDVNAHVDEVSGTVHLIIDVNGYFE